LKQVTIDQPEKTTKGERRRKPERGKQRKYCKTHSAGRKKIGPAGPKCRKKGLKNY